MLGGRERGGAEMSEIDPHNFDVSDEMFKAAVDAFDRRYKRGDTQARREGMANTVLSGHTPILIEPLMDAIEAALRARDIPSGFYISKSMKKTSDSQRNRHKETGA